MASELVGTILRDRRESLGLSIEHMARITNIRPRLLETFESSDYDKYPPKGYASGMLSSYARALGLDPRPILSGFELELTHHHQQLEIEAGAHNVREGRDRFGFKRGSNPSARRPSSSKDAKSSTGSMEPVEDLASFEELGRRAEGLLPRLKPKRSLPSRTLWAPASISSCW